MSKEIIEKDVTSQDKHGVTNHQHSETTIENTSAHPAANEALRTEAKQITNATEVIESNDREHTIVAETIEERTSFRRPSNRNIIVAVVAVVALAALLFLWSRRDNATNAGTNVVVNAGDKGGEGAAAKEANEVKLEPSALAAAKLEIEGVTQRPAVALLRTTGTVEGNPQRTQQVTTLSGGRIERVNVSIGDRVGAGAVLAVVASPEIAEMHGKLREAETRLESAQANLARVQRTENRVAVLSAQAKLDEAEATLRRTRRLVELGAGAGKDLIAAEAEHKTAKAEYDFQSNIPLNRELQEARAELATARVDVDHLRQSLRAFGAPIPEAGHDDHSQNISLVSLRAPASGTVIERFVNAGAGVQSGTTLFTLSNLETVYVIANVPEAQIGSLREGTPAEIRSAALGQGAITGRISYIDPRLSEETRTARARIEVPNPGERLKTGMFVEVGFQTSTGAGAGQELMVPSAAVQRDGERTIVFVPKDNEPGAFEVRAVELGDETQGYHRVISGLRVGERVVTNGSFTLKTQLKKGEMSEE